MIDVTIVTSEIVSVSVSVSACAAIQVVVLIISFILCFILATVSVARGSESVVKLRFETRAPGALVPC